MSRGITSVLAALLLVVAAAALAAAAEQPAPAQGAAGAAGADGFAAQAADAIDNTLLNLKNSINTFFEDGSKIGSFFANVTSSFKKFTGSEKETA